MEQIGSHNRLNQDSCGTAAELIQKMDEVENVLTEFESRAVEQSKSSQRILDLVQFNRWYITNIGIGFEKRHQLRRKLHLIANATSSTTSIGEAIASARFEYAIENNHGLPKMIELSADHSRHRIITEMSTSRHR